MNDDYVHWIRHQHQLGFPTARIARQLRIPYGDVRSIILGYTCADVPIRPYKKKWLDLTEIDPCEVSYGGRR